MCWLADHVYVGIFLKAWAGLHRDPSCGQDECQYTPSCGASSGPLIASLDAHDHDFDAYENARLPSDTDGVCNPYKSASVLWTIIMCAGTLLSASIRLVVSFSTIIFTHILVLVWLSRACLWSTTKALTWSLLTLWSTRLLIRSLMNTVCNAACLCWWNICAWFHTSYRVMAKQILRLGLVHPKQTACPSGRARGSWQMPRMWQMPRLRGPLPHFGSAITGKACWTKFQLYNKRRKRRLWLRKPCIVDLVVTALMYICAATVGYGLYRIAVMKCEGE